MDIPVEDTMTKLTIEQITLEPSAEPATTSMIIPEEDTEKTTTEETWHDNFPRGQLSSLQDKNREPSPLSDKDIESPPLAKFGDKPDVAKSYRKAVKKCGDTSEAQLQRLVTEIAKLKDEILKRQSTTVASGAITAPSRKIEAIGEERREGQTKIEPRKGSFERKVQQVASTTMRERASYEDRYWDEFNETKRMAQLPTARIYRKRPSVDSSEDVDSSEILIPESLTDFTTADDEAERRHGSRLPMFDYIYDVEQTYADSESKSSASRGSRRKPEESAPEGSTRGIRKDIYETQDYAESDTDSTDGETSGPVEEASEDGSSNTHFRTQKPSLFQGLRQSRAGNKKKAAESDKILKFNYNSVKLSRKDLESSDRGLKYKDLDLIDGNLWQRCQIPKSHDEHFQKKLITKAMEPLSKLMDSRNKAIKARDKTPEQSNEAMEPASRSPTQRSTMPKTVDDALRASSDSAKAAAALIVAAGHLTKAAAMLAKAVAPRWETSATLSKASPTPSRTSAAPHRISATLSKAAVARIKASTGPSKASMTSSRASATCSRAFQKRISRKAIKMHSKPAVPPTKARAVCSKVAREPIQAAETSPNSLAAFLKAVTAPFQAVAVSFQTVTKPAKAVATLTKLQVMVPRTKPMASSTRPIVTPTKAAGSPTKAATAPTKAAAPPAKAAASPTMAAASPTMAAASPTMAAESLTKAAASSTKAAASSTKTTVSSIRTAVSPTKAARTRAKAPLVSTKAKTATAERKL
ncbi:hypothetical protein BIW11_00124 [Tropilaelaps mercedesae]|uniref:Uncharacterized protein n=1 Tax=Tropilaelaps mercedesae TaxID=418985 RepID=A0A1V9Y1R0_9ACAR|nr:hypothetical protein BIW11_00124 [Tropilaelaps mercedesae]